MIKKLIGKGGVVLEAPFIDTWKPKPTKYRSPKKVWREHEQKLLELESQTKRVYTKKKKKYRRVLKITMSLYRFLDLLVALI